MTTTLLLYFLAAFGFAFIVGHSKISLAFREWLAARGALGEWLASLLECPACLGFWIGIAAVFTGVIHVPLDVPFGPKWFAALLFACATSGSNLLASKWVGLV